MRIVHFSPRPSFSGLEQYVLQMAVGQKEVGHLVDVVARAESPLADRAEQAGLSVLDLADVDLWHEKIAASEVLHVHSLQDWKLLFPWLHWQKFCGLIDTRVILQAHIWLENWRRDPWHWLLYRPVDEFWCSSTRAQRVLQKTMPLSDSRFRVVHYGRDVARLRAGFLPRPEARATLQLPDDAIVVGAVGRIDPGKGTAELVSGILPLLSANANLHLVWIGEATADDPAAQTYWQNLRQTLAVLDPAQRARLHFPGNMPESFRLLKAFDLFALPSYKECFSLALLEAQAAALPCLGTDAGGTPEVVCESQTGWLFAPQSSLAVQDVLRRALSEGAAWSGYGERAARRVEAEFDWAKVREQIVLAYQELRGVEDV